MAEAFGTRDGEEESTDDRLAIWLKFQPFPWLSSSGLDDCEYIVLAGVVCNVEE